MTALLLSAVFLAPPILSAPDAYGSKDGRIKAKNPLERRARKAEREALKRDASEGNDLRVPIVIGNLPEADLARLPEGVDLASLIAEAFAMSQKIRPVYVLDCSDADCLGDRAGRELSKHVSELEASEGGVAEDGSIVSVSAAAKARDSLGVIILSLDADRRLTMILSETPGRGLLGEMVSAPLEAKDIFDDAFRAGLTRLLKLGSPDEGNLEPVAKAPETGAQGEPAHVLAYRQNLKAKSRYGIYGGAGAAGIGFVLGLYATVNAYRWRRLSYQESEYREQFRGAVSGQALMADLLMIGGGAVAGASYWARGHADQVGAFSWLAGSATATASPSGEMEPPAPSDVEPPVPEADEAADEATAAEPVAAEEESKPRRKLIR